MLKYRIRKGDNKLTQSSAIFLIHGYGSNYDDLFSFAPYLPKNLTIIALEAPLSLAQGSYAWYHLYPGQNGELKSDLNEAQRSLKLITNDIKQLIEKYNINKMDVSVLGFSQGAILSWALAYSKSEIVRRVIALSGYIHESIDTSYPPKFIGYATHGITDEIIPIKMARDSVFPISQKHSAIEYHEFNDGHNVSQENFTKILIWLERTKL